MNSSNRLLKVALLLSIIFVFGENSYCQAIRNINWPLYMAQHDLIWEELPLQWNEGAFVGNGQLGMMIYVSLADNRIEFHLGRQDVTDHRKAPTKKSSLGEPNADVYYDYPRLDIGRMALIPTGNIISGTFRQNLWNAQVTGTIVTDKGVLSFKTYTPHDLMVNIIEVISTEKTPYNWNFMAGNPSSPRALVFPTRKESLEYVTNPIPIISNNGAINLCVQPLLAGGDYATAWTEKKTKVNQSSTLYITTANEVPDSNVSALVATATLKKAVTQKLSLVVENHRKWWHNYYKKSFISIPDGKMESFYWIQMYRLATCSRPDGPAIDLFGPHFRISQWPGLWWNLNVQLTYWPVYASNHLDLGENLITLIDERFDGLLHSFSNAKLGDFAWAMHNYWLQYRYAGDWKNIQTKWVPKAMKIVQAYEKFEITDSLGRIQLIPMGSPEYKGFVNYPNTNYNLALLRWLLNALIESNQRVGANMAEVAKWKKLLTKLVPYPTDKYGLMIASNQSVDMSHRHYSHLLALYPLFQLNPDSSADRDLVERSVLHWHEIEQGKALAGFSFTGAGSLYAALGKGNEAYKILQTFLSAKIGVGMLTSNTFYFEGKGKNPVIETPLSFAASTLELLLQSWGNKIRVFPAVPDKWGKAIFYQLRAQGGFLISASRNNSKTDWISIKSEVGEPCILKTIDWKTAVQVKGSRKFNITALGGGEFAIDLKAGEEILLAPKIGLANGIVEVITRSITEMNPFGVKRGKNLLETHEWFIPEYRY